MKQKMVDVVGTYRFRDILSKVGTTFSPCGYLMAPLGDPPNKPGRRQNVPLFRASTNH